VCVGGGGMVMATSNCFRCKWSQFPTIHTVLEATTSQFWLTSCVSLP